MGFLVSVFEIKIGINQVKYPWQDRVDGPHQKPVARGEVCDADSLPPGCSANFGYPENASPFIQLRLPQGMSYEKKKSRAVSFMDGGSSIKGTKRTQETALNCISSWAWSWWNSLTADEKSSVRNAVSKRRDRSASADSHRSKRLRS